MRIFYMANSFLNINSSTIGEATLSLGVATVNTTKASLTMQVMFGCKGGLAANIGAHYWLSADVVEGVSFKIRSLNVLDNSTIHWIIVDATV